MSSSVSPPARRSARSVDRSVSGALEQFIGELDYLIRLENFTDAEADCLAGPPEDAQ